MILCLLVYVGVFVVLLHKQTGQRSWWHLSNPDLWLCGLVLVGVTNYFLLHPPVEQGVYLVGLLAGLVVGLCARTWVELHTPSSVISKTMHRSQSLMWVLVVLLGSGALWHPDTSSTFMYRGVPRWGGSWGNSNTYGLLMSTGMVLVLGLFAKGISSKANRSVYLRCIAELGLAAVGFEYDKNRPDKFQSANKNLAK